MRRSTEVDYGAEDGDFGVTGSGLGSLLVLVTHVEGGGRQRLGLRIV
jgi:hypothetical protein